MGVKGLTRESFCLEAAEKEQGRCVQRVKGHLVFLFVLQVSSLGFRIHMHYCKDNLFILLAQKWGTYSITLEHENLKVQIQFALIAKKV